MNTIKFLRVVIVLLGLLLGACAPSAVPNGDSSNVGGGKAVSEVIFTGVIESMFGDQWVINGETIQVDPSVVRDGPFQVGDTVKVEASVSADGSVLANRVESPSAADLADNSNDSTEAEPTSAPGDAATQSLVFDDGRTEAFGTLETLTDTSITVGGETFQLAEGAEVNGEFVPGDLVKLEFTTNADGSLLVREVEIADPSQVDNDNSNDDNGNEDNSNDDDGTDDNSNDDNDNDNSDNDNSDSDNNNDDDDDDDDDDSDDNDNG